jgi:hypothetical protein
MADDFDWYSKKIRGIFADPKDIKSMKPGESWIGPKQPIGTDSARFVHEAESVRPLGIALHEKDEPDDTDKYASGGRVKYGSSTHVSCKTKHGG